MLSHEPPGPVPARNREERLAAVLAALPRGTGGERRPLLERFIELWLDHAPSDELDGRADDDIAGAALAHWRLADERDGSAPVHRVSDPVFERDGWQSPHTVLQVVSRDRPWLVSSLRGAFVAAGHDVHLIFHPILDVRRDASGRVIGIDGGLAGHDATSGVAGNGADEETRRAESFIHMEIDGVDESALAGLGQRVEHVFAMLDLVERDGDAMRERLDALAEALPEGEQAAFVRWLDARHFLCLGAGRVHLPAATRRADDATADAVGDATIEAPLGLLDAAAGTAAWSVEDLLATDVDSMFDDEHGSVIVCKAAREAPLLRHEPADLVLSPERDAAGKVISVDCTLGIFVSGLQNEAISEIPWLRERVERVIGASGTAPDSHDGKALAATLRMLPRDMLLQTGSRRLLEMTRGIVELHERRQVRLFSSIDSLGRYCNCLVFIPREAYSRELRFDIERILANHVDGTSTGYDIRFSSSSALARLHFVIRKHPPLAREIDWADIEQRLRRASITWEDRLEQSLRERHDEAGAIALAARYARAFPPGYREDYSARAAAADIDFIETRLIGNAPVMSFYRHIVTDAGTINFKLFVRGEPASLSDVIPVIENMGLRVVAEHPFEIRSAATGPDSDRSAGGSVWIHEFTVEQAVGPNAVAGGDEGAAIRISEAFGEIWSGAVEDDGFNRLILAASLEWRQVVLLRALCKYLLQTRVPFSQAYMIDSLVANAPIARLIVELFERRFDPAADSRDTHVIEERIDAALDAVASLDEDRILRAFRALVLAILRTNAYRTNADGQPLARLSFKIDSHRVPDLPLPRPMVEIFVYSADVEGVHLRGGAVARGGLRWSDRREDFRTEVLGLMKAQMVKNAVIVPVGSKGGFYVKRALPEEREAAQGIVVECYRTFLRGMLDVTDNLVDGAVVAPPDVVRHDGDDPYLVVAADKGTATFSDHANAVAHEYGFWLGDAFASGGSVGYDHKKMGITARGAWESVKRHFRDLGLDTQTEAFTAVGIGDMAGDVFGNGMLLSEEIRLVAAFNHRHVFIDPTPDAAAAFAERDRLFALPRSSWSDYDASLISSGGGVFSRGDKSIRLSPEARRVLGIEDAALVDGSLTPNALISAILKAPVDLLWNGGIGTYVKAATETNADAADRANDALRIDGRALRCRVVGEGGNLGFTQRGRIEYAADGGLIYTDAIDNSAGVDCSDHEVNIKILVNAAVAADDMTTTGRDRLLESMTDEVASLVLKDNYLQTQCIDLAQMDGPGSLGEQSRFMQFLEGGGRLDRDIEYLPNAEEIAERLAAERGLTRPETAVLVSYSKMTMYDELLASALPDEDALESVLLDYFPTPLRTDFADGIRGHRLRREIVATVLTNEFVNRLGPTFGFRMAQELATGSADVVRAFTVVREAFRMPELWCEIEALDNRVPADVQYRMHILVRGLVERATHWLLRSRHPVESIDATIERFRGGLDELVEAMPDCLAAPQRETLDQRLAFFVDAGVPEPLAFAVARVVPMSSSLDIVEIGRSLGRPVDETAAVYFGLGEHLELTWLRERIGELRAASHWHALATSELRSDLHYQQRHLAAEVVGATPDEDAAPARVEAWAGARAGAVGKYRTLIGEMKGSGDIDFAMLSLAVNEVHKLLDSARPLAANA